MAPHPPIKFISTHRVALAFVIFMFPISVRAQAKPDEIKIVVPTVNKASATVSLPAAFWNTHEADWIETALSGRPSNFLHETLLAATTTRTLLENALRDSGCRDGDAWVDSINDFPRLRGDQLLLTLSFARDGRA